MDYQQRISFVRERIRTACERVKRSPDEVTLIAVTKYVDVEATRELIEAGLTDLGENRLQQALPKLTLLADAARWHFIGSLQTNKVKDVLPYFSVIHSLDRLSLAKEIQKQAEKLDIQASCLVQVNISGESTKSGLSPNEVRDFLEETIRLPRIHVCGLMTMAPAVHDPQETRPFFRGLRELRDTLKADFPGLEHLSMGMSGDFEVAVEEGATLVRVGSLLVKP
ncbi:YggS family pyridoxal phosphate-dependent enzyme [Effusibacillus dendaii]|nr:YggS family pyridoxal phosphate-dependent enzyme [Effusibacillus dendaii]